MKSWIPESLNIPLHMLTSCLPQAAKQPQLHPSPTQNLGDCWKFEPVASAKLPRSLRENPALNQISNRAGRTGQERTGQDRAGQDSKERPGRAGQDRKDRAGQGRKEQKIAEGPGRTGQEREGQEGKGRTRSCPNASSISKVVVAGIALALR